MNIKIHIIFATVILFSCQPPTVEEPLINTIPQEESFMLGVDNFVLNYINVIKDKRVGLLTNPSGVNSRFQSTSDILFYAGGSGVPPLNRGGLKSITSPSNL